MTAPRALGRVLLTGSGGFLGLALTRRLRAAGVALVTSDLGGGDRPCDLTDPEATMALMARGPFDTVLHCGAVSGPMVMADRPLDIWRINASGTAHLLEAARRAGAGRLVLCSTTEVYGRTPGTVDETTLPAPASVYAASKVAGEQAMLGYVAQHGLDAVALRLSWLYGPGRTTPTTLGAMLRAALDGTPAVFDAHAGDMTHYLYVEDAVDGLLRAAQTPAPARPVYNITAGRGQVLGEVLACLQGLCPQARIDLAGQPGAETMPGTIDNARAGADLGFFPATPIEAGLTLCLNALRGATPG